jgi:hypothetical protein
MNELHEKCKRKAENVRLYRQRKKADASSIDERIRNAERVRLHHKRFYIFDHTTERGMTEQCSVILHHIHYSCRLKYIFFSYAKVQHLLFLSQMRNYRTIIALQGDMGYIIKAYIHDYYDSTCLKTLRKTIYNLIHDNHFHGWIPNHRPLDYQANVWVITLWHSGLFVSKNYF